MAKRDGKSRPINYGRFLTGTLLGKKARPRPTKKKLEKRGSFWDGFMKAMEDDFYE